MLTRGMLCVLAVGACATAWAQPPARDASQPRARDATQPAARAPFGDAQAKRERLLRAARLPREAQECRRKGVTDADMKETLRAAKRKGLKADETADLTSEQRKAIDEHGPVDNFGAFVQSKLDEGLRGRELAAAIRAEHAKRGKGKGFKGPKDGDKAASKDKDRPDKPDKSAPKPPEDDRGRSGGDKGKGKGKGGG